MARHILWFHVNVYTHNVEQFPVRHYTGSGTKVTIINGDPGGKTGEYMFKPDILSFTVGESVDITLVAESEVHNFSIDALDIDTDIDMGETSAFNYVFDKPGVYQFTCIFHEANGMVGTITVSD
jgi:plastocyanin